MTTVYLSIQQISFTDEGNIQHITFGEFADPISGAEIAEFVRDYSQAMYPNGDKDDTPISPTDTAPTE